MMTLHAVPEVVSDYPTLEAPFQTLKFQRKQTLYHNGDPAQSVFRVRDGLIRITRMTPEGRVLTVRHVMPGDFFGEEAFMSGKREEIAEALTSAQIEAIDPQLINYGDLMTITQSLSKQMQRLMDYEYHLQTGDLRQRVSRYPHQTFRNAPVYRKCRGASGRFGHPRTHRRGYGQHARKRLENHHRAAQ